MRKVIGISVLLAATIWWVSAYTEHNVQSANFLATQSVINDNSSDILDYNLDFNITRREMLKVMMNISGKTVTDTCSGDFSDVGSSDWGCKYAEAALREWYIAANNTFRPDDNVTQIEALKMIMQANNIPRDENDDWRAGYVSRGNTAWILVESYLNYDLAATRGWIFSAGARSYTEFDYTEPEYEFSDEEEEIFKLFQELGI